MNFIKKVLKHITDVNFILRYLFSFKIFSILPDKIYLKILYRLQLGRKLDLKNPKTFNEKLQWLKLNDRKPEYSIMVDKYRVREYIKEKLGEEYIIPLIGVWDRAEDIDFSKLPDKFALKCNHNSGLGMCICRDKSKLDIEKVKKELNKGIKQNYYKTCREWPYKNVERKIICEKYMEQESSCELTDYKFFCFNGEPEFLYVSDGLENHDTARISFVTIDWEFADFKRSDYERHDKLPKKPEKYEEMLEIGRLLSKGFPFLRVDLYEIGGKIYFSELTFSPCGGFMPFTSYESDLKLGEMIKLNGEK